MFNSAWKEQVLISIKQLELQISDLKKSESELRSQNSRLFQIMKNMGRKLALRLPVSLESLEKGLLYDLIFPDELDVWKKAAPHGAIVDLRSMHDFQKSSIPGSINIPFDQIAHRMDTLSKDSPILIVCENGIKSVTCSELLASKGFAYLYVLKGGIALYRGRSADDPSAEEVTSSQFH